MCRSKLNRARRPTGSASMRPATSSPNASPDMKFFRAENCNRRIRTPNGRELTFEVIGFFAGTWRGVFAAIEQADADGLSMLAADPSTAVRAVTQVEYEELSKTKAPTPRGFNPLLSPAATPKQVAILESNAVVVENPSPDDLPQSPTVSTPVASEDVLKPEKL